MFKGKFKYAIILGIIYVAVIAFFDIRAAHSGLFGDLTSYTNGQFDIAWWYLFHDFVLAGMLIVPIAYYFLYRKDKSEAIAVWLTSYILWMFGLADILYFLLQGVNVAPVLPWLNQHPIISQIAHLSGSAVVTSTSLLISVLVGFGLVYIVTKFMEKIN